MSKTNDLTLFIQPRESLDSASFYPIYSVIGFGILLIEIPWLRQLRMAALDGYLSRMESAIALLPLELRNRRSCFSIPPVVSHSRNTTGAHCVLVAELCSSASNAHEALYLQYLRSTGCLLEFFEFFYSSSVLLLLLLIIISSSFRQPISAALSYSHRSNPEFRPLSDVILSDAEAVAQRCFGHFWSMMSGC